MTSYDNAILANLAGRCPGALSGGLRGLLPASECRASGGRGDLAAQDAVAELCLGRVVHRAVLPVARCPAGAGRTARVRGLSAAAARARSGAAAADVRVPALEPALQHRL